MQVGVPDFQFPGGTSVEADDFNKRSFQVPVLGWLDRDVKLLIPLETLQISASSSKESMLFAKLVWLYEGA